MPIQRRFRADNQVNYSKVKGECDQRKNMHEHHMCMSCDCHVLVAVLCREAEDGEDWTNAKWVRKKWTKVVHAWRSRMVGLHIPLSGGALWGHIIGVM